MKHLLTISREVVIACVELAVGFALGVLLMLFIVGRG